MICEGLTGANRVRKKRAGRSGPLSPWNSVVAATAPTQKSAAAQPRAARTARAPLTLIAAPTDNSAAAVGFGVALPPSGTIWP